MRIKEIRISQNLSVPKLVELSGVSRRTIQEVEKRNDCLFSTACKLADALGVTLEDLRKSAPIE